MNPNADAPSNKVLTLEQLLEQRALARLSSEQIVQCHGCFDIVHPGHIRHLRWAAAQGQRLLVSITADRFVNKGAGRPVFTQDLRADNLAALSFVDWVYINEQETAEDLLERSQPDAYVKGAEYEANEDPRFAQERAIVERHGGRVVFSSSDVVFSSTQLVNTVPETVLGTPVRSKLHPLDREYDLSPSAMRTITDRIKGKRIVVVGEPIIDTYIRCTWPDVSSESPMLALRPIEQTRFDAGSAVLAKHLASMGADVVLIPTLPASAEGEMFTERLQDAGIAVHPLIAGDRITGKDRYLVGREKIVKIDHGAGIALDTRARAKLVTLVEEHTLGADACILTDYGLGMFTPHTLGAVTDAARTRTPILTGDVSGRRSSLRSMHNADLLTPSEQELRFAARDYDSSLPTIVWRTLEATGARAMGVTLNEEGVILFTRKQSEQRPSEEAWSSRLDSVHIPSFASHPIDTLGCGDALLALTTAALTTGADLCRSLVLGSLGAAIQASSMGNHTLSSDELRAAISTYLDTGISSVTETTNQQIEPKPTTEIPPRWTSVS